ncbi:uncharacterized protein ISCGN_011439 [Ixodes scapularis]
MLTVTMNPGSLAFLLVLLLFAILANGQSYGDGGLSEFPGRFRGRAGGQFPRGSSPSGFARAFPRPAYAESYPIGSSGGFPQGLSTGARVRTCKEHACPLGTRCVAANVRCVRAPCYPILTCIS